MAKTEWVEDMGDAEFLEELATQFRSEAEKQGMTRDEAVMFLVETQLTLYDCKTLPSRLALWMVDEARKEERIGKKANP